MELALSQVLSRLTEKEAFAAGWHERKNAAPE
jgi:hypothetical protein